MGCVCYAWFSLFAAASAAGLGAARYFFPVYIDGPPLFPLCHYIVAILFLATILCRYIYVDKVQSTFWNGFALIIGIVAIISYICSQQLISSRVLVREYGLKEGILSHVEEGLHCVTPFAVNLYCILQTVVSYKTKGLSRYTGPCMRAGRIIIAVLLTPVAHYLIFTHVTTYILQLSRFGFLADYYPYVYWGYGGLTSLYVLTLGSELTHIKSYCGCLVGKNTAKISPLGMIVTTDNEAEDGITTIDTKAGRIYVAREFTPLPAPRAENLHACSFMWLPLMTGLSAVGLFVARFFTGDFLTVEPMFPYLDHGVAALFLLTIIIRCAHVRKVQPCFFNGIAIIFGLLAVISQTGLVQLPLTPIPIPEISLNIVWIMLGLQCLLPLSTSFYCILQTVVSFKTRIRMDSGIFIRAQRVLISIFVTLTALYIILTHALPYVPPLPGKYASISFYVTWVHTYLILYYQYAYWGFEALTVTFIIGYANEFSRIAMCCGCSKCVCCCKKRSRRIHPMIDDPERPLTRLSTIAEGL